MSELRLTGPVDVLLSHMALLGVAAICEEAGVEGLRISWSTSGQPVPLFSGQDLEGLTVGRIVRDHARRHAEDQSWTAGTVELGQTGKKTVEISACAARTAVPTTAEGWTELEQARREEIDEIESVLDLRTITGIGFRSWWYFRSKDRRADAGCNMWEMRARNRGMELVKDRFRPLAVEIAKWPEEKIWAGLSGDAVDDPHGRNAVDSRSGTGFATPGAVDNARAWCALWGLSFVPVLQKVRSGGAFPAFVDRREAPGSDFHQLLMPVPDRPMSLPRMRMLLRSHELISAVEERGNPMFRLSRWEWLRSHGAGAVLRFPVQYVGSTSAPERQALAGVKVWP